ncbi:hypothetical protein BESB_083030 [Besnoitia besnoiti]|uniref:Uncharacterized protein n=1 Tax=Besnoitia besnoiti TaxID=94643 RepID=A0A2A9M7E2_BESBE|nr:hypothetical protein BESB_083030 [Besnoitia besnoiti]PFH33104.1 hypothetical protein BESB_083030 [Besnoitia besnoiti]
MHPRQSEPGGAAGGGLGPPSGVVGLPGATLGREETGLYGAGAPPAALHAFLRPSSPASANADAAPAGQAAFSGYANALGPPASLYAAPGGVPLSVASLSSLALSGAAPPGPGNPAAHLAGLALQHQVPQSGAGAIPGFANPALFAAAAHPLASAGRAAAQTVVPRSSLVHAGVPLQAAAPEGPGISLGGARKSHPAAGLQQVPGGVLPPGAAGSGFLPVSAGGLLVQQGYVSTAGLVSVTPQQSRNLANAAAATAALAAQAAEATAAARRAGAQPATGPSGGPGVSHPPSGGKGGGGRSSSKGGGKKQAVSQASAVVDSGVSAGAQHTGPPAAAGRDSAGSEGAHGAVKGDRETDSASQWAPSGASSVVSQLPRRQAAPGPAADVSGGAHHAGPQKGKAGDGGTGVSSSAARGPAGPAGGGERDEAGLSRETSRNKPQTQGGGRRDGSRGALTSGAGAWTAAGGVYLGEDVLTAVAVEDESLRWSLFISNALRWAAAPALDYDVSDGGWGATPEETDGTGDIPQRGPPPGDPAAAQATEGGGRGTDEGAASAARGTGESAPVGDPCSGLAPLSLQPHVFLKPGSRNACGVSEERDEEEVERQQRRACQARERLRRKARLLEARERLRSHAGAGGVQKQSEKDAGAGLFGFRSEAGGGDKAEGVGFDPPRGDSPHGSGEVGAHDLNGAVSAAPSSRGLWGESGTETGGDDGDALGGGSGGDMGYLRDSGLEDDELEEEEEEEDPGLLRVLGVCCTAFVEEVMASAASYAVTLRSSSSLPAAPLSSSLQSALPCPQPSAARFSGPSAPEASAAPAAERGGLAVGSVCGAAAAVALESGGTGRAVEVTKQHVDLALERLWGESTVQRLLQGIRERKRANRARLRQLEAVGVAARLAKAGGRATAGDAEEGEAAEGGRALPRAGREAKVLGAGGEEARAHEEDEDMLAEELFLGGCFGDDGNEGEADTPKEDLAAAALPASPGGRGPAAPWAEGEASEVAHAAAGGLSPDLLYYKEALETSARWDEIDRLVARDPFAPFASFHADLAQAEYVLTQRHLQKTLELHAQRARDRSPAKEPREKRVTREEEGPFALGEAAAADDDSVKGLLAKAQALAQRNREKVAQKAVDEEMQVEGAGGGRDQDGEDLLFQAFDFSNSSLALLAHPSASLSLPVDSEHCVNSGTAADGLFVQGGVSGAENGRQGAAPEEAFSPDAPVSSATFFEEEDFLMEQRGGAGAFVEPREGDIAVAAEGGEATEDGTGLRSEGERQSPLSAPEAAAARDDAEPGGGLEEGGLDQALEDELEESLLMGMDGGGSLGEAAAGPGDGEPAAGCMRDDEDSDLFAAAPGFSAEEIGQEASGEDLLQDGAEARAGGRVYAHDATEFSHADAQGEEDGDVDLEEELFAGLEEDDG